jgi:hypothetical protein
MRDSLHLLAGANDYRTVDAPFYSTRIAYLAAEPEPEEETRRKAEKTFVERADRARTAAAPSLVERRGWRGTPPSLLRPRSTADSMVYRSRWSIGPGPV